MQDSVSKNTRRYSLALIVLTVLAYANIFNAPFIFYLVIPIFLTGFCFIPIAAGTLFVLLPIGWFKTKRVRQIFNLLAWVAAFLIWMMFISILNPSDSAFIFKILNLPELKLTTLLQWMPPGLVSTVIALFLTGKTFYAITYGLPLIILPIGFFHLARINPISRVLFLEPVMDFKKKSYNRVITGGLRSPFATVLRSMIISSIRDYDYGKQKLLSMFTVVILFLLAQRHYFRLLLFYLTLFPMLSMHIDATLISREGKSFWWFKVGQDKIFYFVLSKFLVSFLGSLILVTAVLGCLVVAYGHYWTVDIVAIGWLRLVAVSLCFAGLSMVVGSMFPNFQHPRFKLNASGHFYTFLFMISGLIYSAYNMDLLRASANFQIFFELMIAIFVAWGCLKKAAMELKKMEWKI